LATALLASKKAPIGRWPREVGFTSSVFSTRLSFGAADELKLGGLVREGALRGSASTALKILKGKTLGRRQDLCALNQDDDSDVADGGISYIMEDVR
jgi:hypothetical protein